MLYDEYLMHGKYLCMWCTYLFSMLLIYCCNLLLIYVFRTGHQAVDQRQVASFSCVRKWCTMRSGCWRAAVCVIECNVTLWSHWSPSEIRKYLPLFVQFILIAIVCTHYEDHCFDFFLKNVHCLVRLLTYYKIKCICFCLAAFRLCSSSHVSM